VSSSLLTAPHYEELVLPVLRRASPNQGACPMQLVMLSRPCTLSTAQRREAVLHACRLAAAHAATSVQRSCCCTMLLKLINDRHLGEPLLAPGGAPGGAPPHGENDDRDDGALAAVVAAIEHGGLEILLESLARWAACAELQQQSTGRLYPPLAAAQPASPPLSPPVPSGTRSEGPPQSPTPGPQL
jgi:hypothetical protein